MWSRNASGPRSSNACIRICNRSLRRRPRREQRRGRQRRPPSARNRRAVRAWRSRAHAARGLQRRPHSPCVADRWASGNRQGDAGLSAGALRARASRSACCRRCRRQLRWRSMRTMRSPAASPRRRKAIFWCLSACINEQTGKLYTVIRVDDVRKAVPFFGSTAGEGGWRIAIVDAVDDLQREGANALLKVLEEPPPRTLLLLVSHAPGRELPTIRSRCRRLLLRPLSPERCGPRSCGGDRPQCGRCRGAGCVGRGRRQRRPRHKPARRICGWRCASACSTCSRSCPIPIRARCMRSATRSAAASRRRSPPSWTWSTAGCRRG